MVQRRLIPSTSMLLAFDAAARNGSFTAAASELNLTQGAVSRQVSALEAQLNVSLFRRVSKSIQLTEAGRIYAHDIGDALRAIRNASLNAMSDPQGGILNLAVLPTFGMRWLMPRFPDFLKQNPQVTVNFASKLKPFDFRDENLHAAIHFGRNDWPRADSTFLMGEEAVPVAAPALMADTPLEQPIDLLGLPMLHLETRPGAWVDWFRQNDLEAPVRGGMTFEQFAILTQAAVAGMGAALLPRFLIQTELERGELKILIDRPLDSDEGYHLVTPTHRSSYPPVTALRNWLLKETAGKQ